MAVKLKTAGKYIFVSRTAMKLGEFSKDQLIDMLVTKDCEILTGGIEIENTLEKVVSGLRKRRSLDDDNK